MLDAVSRLAESEQRAWVSEVERTVQQRQMLSKAQEVSQAIGAEMRRAREAIIAEYGPGVFDSAAASGAVADLPTRALGLLAAAAAPAARNADELQLEHSLEVMEELTKAKGKLRQREEALRERDLELSELREQLEGLRLQAARAEHTVRPMPTRCRWRCATRAPPLPPPPPPPSPLPPPPPLPPQPRRRWVCHLRLSLRGAIQAARFGRRTFLLLDLICPHCQSARKPNSFYTKIGGVLSKRKPFFVSSVRPRRGDGSP